ncbi:MAG: hypothetical protein LBO20_04900 [Bifidobacteriaceae bacterium]|jgi:mycothiol S-conjugate amidase|nr:hypothetical protein [Bifidobacteriaceae bacterium]
MAALEQAADPAFRADLGQPFVVPKVYYDQGISPDRIAAAHQAMIARGLDSPYGDWVAGDRRRKSKLQYITTRVPVADYFAVRDAALKAHASQVDPDGWFFAMPRDIEREVWPHEDFELVSSQVPTTIPEDDLFAGLR